MNTRLLLIATFTFCFFATELQAQTTTLPTIKLDSKADHITAAIDTLHSLKRAVTQRRKGKELETFKALGIRLFQCALVYSMLSKSSEFDINSRTAMANASEITSLMSVFLFPDSTMYARDTEPAAAEIKRMMETKDKQRVFYMLRNCKELGSPDLETVANAIVELTL